MIEIFLWIQTESSLRYFMIRRSIVMMNRTINQIFFITFMCILMLLSYFILKILNRRIIKSHIFSLLNHLFEITSAYISRYILMIFIKIYKILRSIHIDCLVSTQILFFPCFFLDSHFERWLPCLLMLFHIVLRNLIVFENTVSKFILL